MAIEQTTARLEARLPVEVHATLRRAAEIEGRTLTDFVVDAAHKAALHTIESAEIIRLTSADQLRFAEALINPPSPNAALQRAKRHHSRLILGN
jgi:uncharacterized protein (DUF1778 family)